MSDTPRDQGTDAAAAGWTPRSGGRESADEQAWSGESAEPTTGPPAGAAGPWADPPAEAAERVEPADGTSRTEPAGTAGRTAPAGAGRAGIAGGFRRAWAGMRARAGMMAGRPGGTRPRATFAPAAEPDPESEAGRRLRRRRRLFLTGIAVAAAVVAVALCAGALSIVAAVHGARDRATAAAETRQWRETACLELERRLNRLSPPGATTTPQSRAAAVQNENTAVRIYVAEIRGEGEQDTWRQLLDARTAYAEALAQQAKTRTPAFYVAPRAGDGRAVSDQLVDASPAPCAGTIRRLATPDL